MKAYFDKINFESFISLRSTDTYKFERCNDMIKRHLDVRLNMSLEEFKSSPLCVSWLTTMTDGAKRFPQPRPNDFNFKPIKDVSSFIDGFSKDDYSAIYLLDDTKVDEVINVFKSYISRVGEGPFPTEMTQEEAESQGLEEYGVVTGRRRRIGYFDMELAKESCRINGATQIALTCVDKLFDCARVQNYDELSAETKVFINDIQTETGVPVTIISTGPDLKDTIDLRKELL